MTVEPRSIPYTPVFVAQTESSRQVNIVARVSGFLDSIAYQEGELVKQGQLMFKLDPKPFQAQLNAARGELESQQARYETAQVTYGRVKPLAEQDALPQTDLDRAKGELDAARAAVFSAQAKVDEAQLNLGYATITSPLTGVASRALQRQGAYVNSLADSANLTYVAALDPIWVNFSISQNQMARYKELAEKGPGGAAQGRELRRRAGAARRRGVSATRQDRLRRSVVQPGYRLVPRARGDTQSQVRSAARHVRDRARHRRNPAQRDRGAAARRAAGQQGPPRLCGQCERCRGSASGGGRRLLRRPGYRDPAGPRQGRSRRDRRRV